MAQTRIRKEQVDSTLVTLSSTSTLTNKRVTKRTGTTTSSATPTINTDNVDYYSLTAQAVDITSFTTNLSGTPTDAQTLWISITGTASRAITWGSSFESSAASLPTTTITTNRLDVGLVWNAASSKWRCVAVTNSSTIDISVKAIQTGTTTLGTAGNWVSCAFASEEFDTDNMHDNATNNTRITFNTAGKYVIGGVVGTAANAIIGARIRLNGTTVLAGQVQGNSAQGERACVVTTYVVSAADYVELQGQAAGNTSTGDSQTHFWAYKLAS